MVLGELPGSRVLAPAVHMYRNMSGMSLHQRNVSKDVSRQDRECNESNGDGESSRSKEDPKFSLMEELMLLVMDPKGFISIWNDHVSRALRGCILIELWMRGKSVA